MDIDVDKIPLPDDMNELVRQVVTTRDRLEVEKTAFKKKTEKAAKLLDRLEAKLLERLNEIGGNSVKTDHGTAFRSHKKSASIKDGDKFRKFVIDNNEFDIVDWRANANAVADYIEQHKATPPGVNYSISYTVNVRRA